MGRQIVGLDIAALALEALDQTPTLVSYVDSHHRYRYANRAYQAWFGLPAAEITGRTLEEVLGPEAYASLRPYVEQALRGEETVFERPVPYRPGGPRVIRARYVPDVVEEEARGFFAYVEDISGERAEAAAATLRLAVSDMVQSETQPHRVVAVASELLGGHLDASCAGFAEIEPGADAATIRHAWSRADAPPLAGPRRLDACGADGLARLRAGETVAIEDVLADPATAEAGRSLGVGASVCAPILEHGRLVAVVFVLDAAPRRWTDMEISIVREIGERAWSVYRKLRADARLRDSETRLHWALEAARGVAWSVDLREGDDWRSPGASQLLGVEADAPMTLERALEVVHEADAPRVQRALEDAVASGADCALDFRIRHPEKGLRWIAFHGRVVADQAGLPARVIGVAFDDTDGKDAEERLRRSERRLRLLTRVDDVARRLRDPEALVAGAMTALRDELEADRCVWADVEPDEDHFTFIGGATADGAPYATGRFPVSAFGSEALTRMRAGLPFVCEDAAAEPPEGADQAAYAATGIRALIATPLLRDGRLIAGCGVHMLSPRAWSDDDVELVEAVTQRCWEAMEWVRAERALQRAHMTLRRLVDQSPFGVFVVDAELRVLQVSAGARPTLGDPAQLIGRSLDEVFRRMWAEPVARETADRFRRTLETGEPFHAPEAVSMRADLGVRQALDWRIERILLADERWGVVCHFYDLTERRRQEEQVRLLMAEVNHRSKNMLAVVHTIARHTASGGAADFLVRFEERVAALAASHDLLVGGAWSGVDVGELVRSQLAHVADLIGVRIAVDGPTVRLNAAAARTIGMAVHELATNAGKHGALSGGGGRIAVSWAIRRNGGEGRFGFRWVESGGPPVTPPPRRGFGSTVLERLSSMTLDADVTLDFAPSGLVWALDCPARRALEGEVVAAPERAPHPPRREGRRRVLVVEDEAIVALDMAGALEAAGFTVVGPAASVDHALDLLDRQGCDAAVLDINLGRETSEAVAERLLKDGAPFVSVSGYAFGERPAAFAGAPFISKPLLPHRLIAAVSALMRPGEDARRH